MLPVPAFLLEEFRTEISSKDPEDMVFVTSKRPLVPFRMNIPCAAMVTWRAVAARSPAPAHRLTFGYDTATGWRVRRGCADGASRPGRPPGRRMTRLYEPAPAGAQGRRLAWRLAGEVRPYWRSALVIFFVNLAAVPLVLLTPVPLKIAVDNVLGDKPLPRYLDVLLPDAATGTDLRLLLVAAVMQVVVVVLGQLQTMTSYVLRVRTGELMTQAIREKLFGHAQRLSLLRHDSRGSSDSVYRIQYDAAELQKVTVDGLLTSATAAITLVITFVVVCRLDWMLAAVGLLVSLSWS